MNSPTISIRAVATLIAEGDIGASEHRRFADVAVVSESPQSREPGFYPEDRYVVTRHDEELGWLFERMARAFGGEPGYGMWKEELFGRLGNCANWYLAQNPQASAQDLCLAVCLEGLVIADEMADGFHLPEPAVVFDNQVADDARDPLNGSRPVDRKGVRDALAARGVGV